MMSLPGRRAGVQNMWARKYSGCFIALKRDSKDHMASEASSLKLIC